MAEDQNSPDVSAWTPELLRQRRRRAAIMAVGILVLVGLFFAVTIVRLAENVAKSAGQS